MIAEVGNYLENIFFAPQGKYDAAGMFGRDHFIALGVCVCVISLCLILSRDMTERGAIKTIRVLAFVMPSLEIVKIAYCFAHGYTNIDSWVPLSFCSLTLYALPLAGFGVGGARSVGLDFLGFGAFTGGLAFLIVPATSLMSYSIGHFQCLYSMFFHSVMVYTGLICIRFFRSSHNKKDILRYIAFILSAEAVATIINIASKSNLMLLSEPYNIPIDVVVQIAGDSHIAYFLGVTAAYTAFPVAVSFAISRISREIGKESKEPTGI